MTKHEEEIASPCVQICTLDAGNVCTGCGRSLEEIAQWGAATVSRKRQILMAAAERRRHLSTSSTSPDQR
ncbi:MAG: DUF1289 domain-containing protein [Nevskiales bacterium]|nr:DUF1289 domain-containing protein [Nevskiales bacterium]